ncbi:MarR family transcriptional regulator [Ignavibacteria bacterium]
MGSKLFLRLKQTKPVLPQTEAFLNILVAADYFRQIAAKICAAEGINLTQHNILRILNGIYPDGYPRYEIRQRLVERGSDITRHIDKLVVSGLVERFASDSDKRLSITRITPKGMELLHRLVPKMDQGELQIAVRLSIDECKRISKLCEKIYDE